MYIDCNTVIQFNYYYSTQPKAINPRRRVKDKERIPDDDEDEETVKTSRDPDKIDPWGDNPDWDPSWVKAHKINYLGRVSWEEIDKKTQF